MAALEGPSGWFQRRLWWGMAMAAGNSTTWVREYERTHGREAYQPKWSACLILFGGLSMFYWMLFLRRRTYVSWCLHGGFSTSWGFNLSQLNLFTRDKCSPLVSVGGETNPCFLFSELYLQFRWTVAEALVWFLAGKETHSFHVNSSIIFLNPLSYSHTLSQTFCLRLLPAGRSTPCSSNYATGRHRWRWTPTLSGGSGTHQGRASFFWPEMWWEITSIYNRYIWDMYSNTVVFPSWSNWVWDF